MGRWTAFVDALAGVFRRRVVVYDPDGGGLPRGLTNTGIRNTIFLNADNVRPHFYTMGHELWHHLQVAQPELAAQVREMLEPLLIRKGELAKEKAEYQPQEHFDELIGDFLGDNFARQGFWNDLAAKAPEVFVKTARVITRWLDQVMEALRGQGYGSDRYFRDIAKARSILTDAVAEFAIRENNGKPTERPIRDTPESPHSENLYSEKGESDTPRSRENYTPSALEILDEAKQSKGLQPSAPLAAFGEGSKFQNFLQPDKPATRAEVLEGARQLEQWAEANRRWIAPKTIGRLMEEAADVDNGTEHKVFLFESDHQKAFVIKATYDGKFGKENRTPAAYLNRWALFNAAVPEAAAQFIGYTKDSQGRGVIVMAQPYILGEKGDQAAITQGMAAKGFVLSEQLGVIYRNPETGVEIHDAHDDNVLFKADGTMVPIDVWINDPQNFYKLRPE
jgi:hypothetical protein